MKTKIIIFLTIISILGLMAGSAHVFFKNAPKCGDEKVVSTLAKLAKQETLTMERMLKARIGSFSGSYSVPEPAEEIDDSFFMETRKCKAEFYLKNSKSKNKVLFNDSDLTLNSMYPTFEELKEKKYHNFILKDENIFDNFTE